MNARAEKLFLKVAERVEVAPVVRELEAHPDLWNAYSLRKIAPGTPHGGMTDIWVRYNSIENLGPHFNDEHDAVWYPAWYALPSLRGIVFPLMSLTEGVRLGGILITKIPPGEEIKPHSDKGWHVRYYDKFYVSLQSAPGANFYSGDECINPKTGDIWRFDNRLEHWVKNESAIDRITLIICIRTDKYRGIE